MPKSGRNGAGAPSVANGSESAAALRSSTSQQAILAAARELFTSQGYSATSISEIVTRAGTSVGLPYYHFGSKKKIFVTLWSEFEDSQMSRTRTAVAAARRAGASGKELLLVGTRAYLEGAWQDRDIVPLVLSRDTPAGFDAVMREVDRKWERQNRALLSDYEPELVRTAAVLLGGALRAVCLEFPRCKSETEAFKLIEDALLLYSGLLSGLVAVK